MVILGDCYGDFLGNCRLYQDFGGKVGGAAEISKMGNMGVQPVKAGYGPLLTMAMYMCTYDSIYNYIYICI